MYSHLTEIRYSKNGQPWIWPKNDIAAWQLLPAEWPELQTAIEQYVPVKDVVVQAGGCSGMYPRFLANMFRQVLTFEPHPVNFHCLVANCQENNISKVQGALGARSELGVLLEYDTRNTGMHYMLGSQRTRDANEMTGESYSTQIFSVDSLGLRTLNLLMLDAEGYEQNIIDGALRTIVSLSPVIICEFPGDAIITRLRSLGYENVAVVNGDSVFVR